MVQVKSSSVLRVFRFWHDEPEHFVTTQWTKDMRKSFWFLLYRWILAGFFIGVVAYSWTSSISRSQFGFWFIYMTNLGLLICVITTTFAAALVSLYHFDAIAINSKSSSYKLYWLLSNISTVFAFIITVVYWSILFNGKTSTLDILVHGGNSAAMLIDLVVVRHPFYFFHFVYTIAGGLIYFIFTIIYFVAGGVDSKGNRYIYHVLNWEEPGRALTVALGVMVLGIFLHTFACVVQRMRRRIHKKVFKINSVTITNSIHQTV